MGEDLVNLLPLDQCKSADKQPTLQVSGDMISEAFIIHLYISNTSD